MYDSDEKNNTPVRVVLLDDEEEACQNLWNIIHNYCENSALIEIVGIAYSTRQAEELIQRLKPDALFIDIEMPVENGFQFLERIAPFQFEIIFVTAYDKFALKALKLNALDYILKPISISEIQQAIYKLKERMGFARFRNEKGLFKDFSEAINEQKETEVIRLRTTTSMEVVAFSDIYFIEALGAYSKFHFNKKGSVKEIMMSYSIIEYEHLLPKDIFFRIHKSYLVNCLKAEAFIFEPTALLQLHRGFKLPVGRRRQAGLISFLEKHKIQLGK